MQKRKLRDLEVSELGLGCPAQVALAWLREQKPFIVPIFGTTNPQRLEENINSLTLHLSEADLQAINAKLDTITIKGDRYSGENAKRIGK